MSIATVQAEWKNFENALSVKVSGWEAGQVPNSPPTVQQEDCTHDDSPPCSFASANADCIEEAVSTEIQRLIKTYDLVSIYTRHSSSEAGVSYGTPYFHPCDDPGEYNERLFDVYRDVAECSLSLSELFEYLDSRGVAYLDAIFYYSVEDKTSTTPFKEDRWSRSEEQGDILVTKQEWKRLEAILANDLRDLGFDTNGNQLTDTSPSSFPV
jgi:hypothetical protein